MTNARLARIELPDFGPPARMPELGPAVYQRRLERLRAKRRAAGFDVLVVWADREHSANVAYLTGFDPRFEEALLIEAGDGDAAILVGNENFGVAGAAPLPMRRHLFQDFSLPGQPRDRSLPLRDLLAEEGLRRGARVGLIGWKTYGRPEASDLPAYLVDQLRELAGPDGTVENATDLLIDAADGLRVINEVEQIAMLEYAACHTSSAIRRLWQGLEPGMTEQQAVTLLGWNGMPLSCHLMLTAGPRAHFGLLSPSDRPIERGDPLTVAFGVWGALNCRAGFVAKNASQLAPAIGDYVDRLVGPYFEAVAEWYSALCVGQKAGALYEIVGRRLGDPFFGVSLNPGHQIQLDEWVNSPISRDSQVELRSGMAFQVDIIPATGGPYFTTNIEDGIVLADEALRAEVASRYPDMWQRIDARRAFMAESLGIRLHQDVLPLSNIPAYLPPFVLAPDSVMTLA